MSNQDILERLRCRTSTKHGGLADRMTGWKLTETDSELHRDAANEITKLKDKLKEIQNWYDTDGSVGGLSQIMD